MNSAQVASRLFFRAFPSALPRFLAFICILILGFHTYGRAEDWGAPEQELAKKILASTGNAGISLTFENRSSLGRRDAEIIQNGLRSALVTTGARVVENDPAAVQVTVSLSENVSSYVWVAQIQKAGSETQIEMVSFAKSSRGISVRASVPLELRSVLLWKQPEPILDIAVLEENLRIAVLSPDNVSIYRIKGGSSQLEASQKIIHARPWPRDVRGRIVPAANRSLDVYLPGMLCNGPAGSSLQLNCREGNEPWPLMFGVSGAASNSPTTARAFPEASRNYFTGVETGPGNWLKIVPQFYSAALIPREPELLWFFAAMDGQTHRVEDGADQTVNMKWGSDLTSVRTSCGAGWQLLATSPVHEGPDSVRAYEIPDRDPVAVSAAAAFAGPVTALWTEAKGDSAIAVAKNAGTGDYEAFRVAVACSR